LRLDWTIAIRTRMTIDVEVPLGETTWTLITLTDRRRST
jgi:hypothetical protein